MNLFNVCSSSRVIFTVLAVLLSVCTSEAVEFSLPTTDGLYTLTGEIDFPDQAQKAFPLVIMVPGTGLFDRNVLFGHSGTDRDFVFKDLSKALNAVGIATLRFDYRGVHCNSRVNPVISNCVDNNVRQMVTPENIQSDILQLFNYGSKISRVDSSKVSIFAHSEGTLHTARLIGAKLINPKFITLVGMVAESPKSIIRYQKVERQVENLFDADSKRHGVLTNVEIQTACGAANLTQDICDKLKSPSGSWTRKSFAAPYEAGYQQALKDAISTADDKAFIPNPEKPVIQASYRWWKMWFIDDRNAVDDLLDYKGKIFAHNGEIDSQTPGNREFDLVRSKKSSFASFPVLTLHSGKGHGLSNNPLYGPIDPDIQSSIVSEIFSAMQ